MELLQALKAQNDKLLQEVTQMKEQLSGLDGKYQAILAGLADNKKELEALKGQVENLRTQLADQLKKIDQLTAQLTTQGADLVKISKEITEGGLTTLTCHLVDVENNLGRSTVIDLTAKSDNKFRQIDHRTI